MTVGAPIHAIIRDRWRRFRERDDWRLAAAEVDLLFRARAIGPLGTDLVDVLPPGVEAGLDLHRIPRQALPAADRVDPHLGLGRAVDGQAAGGGWLVARHGWPDRPTEAATPLCHRDQ